MKQFNPIGSNRMKSNQIEPNTSTVNFNWYQKKSTSLLTHTHTRTHRKKIALDIGKNDTTTIQNKVYSICLWNKFKTEKDVEKNPCVFMVSENRSVDTTLMCVRYRKNWIG